MRRLASVPHLTVHSLSERQALKPCFDCQLRRSTTHEVVRGFKLQLWRQHSGIQQNFIDEPFQTLPYCHFAVRLFSQLLFLAHSEAMNVMRTHLSERGFTTALGKRRLVWINRVTDCPFICRMSNTEKSQ